MDILCGFEVNEMGDVIPRRESLHELALVLVNSAFEVTGDSCVKGLRLTGHNVDIVLLDHHVPALNRLSEPHSGEKSRTNEYDEGCCNVTGCHAERSEASRLLL